MTSEEIKHSPSETNVNHHEAEQAFWLREIAYQLAVMNEHKVYSNLTPSQKLQMSGTNLPPTGRTESA